ncbi:MAG: glycogen debranching protein, partial [Salegentibacter sp.]
PDGFGMMEIHGLDSEMIDVAVYTQRAFVDAAKIASELNENKLASDYAGKAAKLKQKINDQFWAEEFNSYADFIGTEQQALRLIEDAIVRADTLQKPWAVSELKNTREKILKQPAEGEKAFVLYHNWVVNTPMEMNIADQEKAEKALRTAEKFLNPFGLFVTGIDRDESAGKDEGSFKGSKVFSYTGAVMTLPTGVLAIAENNYGHPDKALDLLNRMTRSFSYALPGSMYEVSPDYGMMTQAWNIYAFAIPIVQQFFGIDPMASEKEVLVKPQMPSAWKKASLENVEIGQNKLSVFFEETAEGKHFRITQTDAEWKVKLILPQHQKRLKVLAGKSSETGENIEIVSDEKNLEVWLLN